MRFAVKLIKGQGLCLQLGFFPARLGSNYEF